MLKLVNFISIALSMLGSAYIENPLLFENKTIYVTTNRLGPYEDGIFNTSHFTFRTETLFRNHVSFQTFLEFDYDNKSEVIWSQDTFYTMKRGEHFDFEYDFDYSKMKVKDQITIRFYCLEATTNGTLAEIVFDIDLRKPSAKDVYEYATYHSYYSWKYDKSIANHWDDYFDFNVIPSMAYYDTYYRLDPAIFDFIYKSDYKRYNYAALRITNYPDCLSSLDPFNLGIINLELELEFNEDNTIHISFRNYFYIKKSTFEQSLTPKKGYVPTKFLYLPPNHLNEMGDMHLYFMFNGVGFTRQSFFINTQFAAGRYLLGECHNSDYCVVGGVRQ